MLKMLKYHSRTLFPKWWLWRNRHICVIGKCFEWKRSSQIFGSPSKNPKWRPCMACHWN